MSAGALDGQLRVSDWKMQRRRLVEEQKNEVESVKLARQRAPARRLVAALLCRSVVGLQDDLDFPLIKQNHATHQIPNFAKQRGVHLLASVRRFLIQLFFLRGYRSHAHVANSDACRRGRAHYCGPTDTLRVHTAVHQTTFFTTCLCRAPSCTRLLMRSAWSGYLLNRCECTHNDLSSQEAENTWSERLASLLLSTPVNIQSGRA